MQKGLISIIVPCFKQAQFLDDCLQSVLEQTYQNWECIIVDDGSPDNTEEIAKKWIKKDKRFKYVYQENKGLSSARNFGIQNSKGVFILPLDPDDKISKDYISYALNIFKKDQDIKLVYCRAEKFGEEIGVLDLKPFSLYELALNNMIFCSAIFRKRDWKEIGGYDENMIHGWEDWEFWIALLKKGGKVNLLNHTGFFYRIKSESMLKSMTKRRQNKALEYLSLKHPDFFIAQLGTFIDLEKKIKELQSKNEIFQNRIKSKKYIIDLFFKTFFGFTIFRRSHSKI
ncbi:glycosyltransferase family 2 protein [Gillisia sp. CAL575]|uniref:glycosyltransferase family 2 protein n=1 Tax=Gillisia sp. CAL575 TaxID=985255 RepID=UPI00039D664B|nr:glycosyltransferase family A protein [Gillisia sp. CAL575]